MKKYFLSLVLGVALVVISAPDAFAESWWGDGARSNAWVIAHGGSIIHYKIIASGAKDRYKAIIYKDGKVVEWENGKIGLFDDPKNDTYVVKAFRGGVEKDKTSKGGKKILSSGPIVAHPGETIYVTLDDLNNKVTVTSNRRVAVPAKPAPEKADVPVSVPAPSPEEPIQAVDAALTDYQEPSSPSDELIQKNLFISNIFNLDLGRIKP